MRNLLLLALLLSPLVGFADTPGIKGNACPVSPAQQFAKSISNNGKLTCAVPDPGTTGITSLNGLTAATQTFATPGTSGTAPAWSSSGSSHTLNIPLASASSVTAGLLSKTSYDLFYAKESPLTFSTPILRSSDTISCQVATGSVPGCLAAADWTSFNAKAPLASPTFTGQVTVPAGAITTPSVVSTASGSRYTGQYYEDLYGAPYDPAMTLSFGGSDRFRFEGYRGGDNEAIFSIGGGHANASPIKWNTTGAINWTIPGSAGVALYSSGSTGMSGTLSGDSAAGGIFSWGPYIGGSSSFDTSHWSLYDNSNHFLTLTHQGDTSVGGGTRTKLVTLTVMPLGNVTIRGTTTVNGSTTVTGSGTRFLEEVGIGDGLAVSSASSTFCEITAIASNTSLTTACVLGNGTSQTLTRKHALQLVMDKDGTVVEQTLPDGTNRHQKQITSTYASGAAIKCTANDTYPCIGNFTDPNQGLFFYNAANMRLVYSSNSFMDLGGQGLAVFGKIHQYDKILTATMPVTALNRNASQTAVGNTAATPTDVFSKNLEAGNWATNGASYTYELMGTFANTASTDKSVKITLDGNTLHDTGSITGMIATGSWVSKTKCTRRNSTTAVCGTVFSTNLTTVSTVKVITATLANTLVIKATINGTNANDTQFEEGWLLYNNESWN